MCIAFVHALIVRISWTYKSYSTSIMFLQAFDWANKFPRVCRTTPHLGFMQPTFRLFNSFTRLQTPLSHFHFREDEVVDIRLFSRVWVFE